MSSNEDLKRSRRLHRITIIISNMLYVCASISLIVASFCMVAKAVFDIWTFIVVKERVSKEILDAISFTIIAIAVFDVGRYLIEEEVQREKELRSPTEARRTLTRFMVVITIALALEGLVGVFEAGNHDIRNVLFPVSLVICAVLVMVGLGIYQRLSIATERELRGGKSAAGYSGTGSSDHVEIP